MNHLSSKLAAWTRLFSGWNRLHTNRIDAMHSPRRPAPLRWAYSGFAGVLMALWLGATGCQSTAPTPLAAEDKSPFLAVGVQPGDILRITFPAAPTLNSVQQVQSDGNVTLPLGGTIPVKGKSPGEIEKDVLKAYDSQLVTKEVSVSVESAGFSVYISGAVLRPGKVQCRQSMTVLEAISEAGGFAQGRANLKNVKVVRQTEGGATRTYVLDLQKMLRGESGEPFYIRPSDVVYVPERFAFY